MPTLFGRPLGFGKPRDRCQLSAVGSWIEELKKQVESEPGDVVVDISHVQTVNSEELSAVARVHLALAQAERKLRLVNASPQVEEVFSITRMDRLVRVTGVPA